MRQAQTVTGKRFHYNGNLTNGLMVHTSDIKGNMKAKGFRIYPDTIDIIKKSIMASHEIPMGACRDNPSKDSIGIVLRLHHKSPQMLCYVIPILADEGFCTYYKKGNAYHIKLI